MKLIKFFIDYFFIYRVKRINLLNEFERRREISIDVQINFYEIIFWNVYYLINIFLNVRVLDY